MPLYDFLCTDCKIEYEVKMPMANVDDPIKCPECGKELQKQIGSPFFVIK